MISAVDRILARARGPLSPVQPVLPSIFAAERSDGRMAKDSLSPVHAEDSGANSIKKFRAPEPAQREGSRPMASAVDSHTLSHHAAERIPSAALTELTTVAAGHVHAVESPGRFTNKVEQTAASLPGEQATILRHEERSAAIDRQTESTSPWAMAGSTSAQSAGSIAPIKSAASGFEGRRTAPPQAPIEVNVAIGSIEFRSAAPQPAAPRQSSARPSLTLETYLKRGEGAGR